jgi:uncharacterized protein (TIGR02301 family)
VPIVCAAMVWGQAAACAQSTDKPYDDRLLRLAEILGAIHYLRELCAANDGQTWRDQMRGLVDAEGSSALRRARLAQSFNRGYQNYSRTYKVCTPTAETAISRFMVEGAQIAETLVKTIP